jgi:cytochrome c oxidase subunit 2
MAIYPPTERIWWKEPVARAERIWITVAFLWGLVMFFMMVYWHVVGKQNLSNEAYRISPATYQQRAVDAATPYIVREEGGIPVVKPPPGTDIYMIARLWQWWPIFELQKGQDYRLHISSVDWQHGFSLQPINVNLQIHPGYDMVLTITPDQSGNYGIVCNEYCGIGHHTMVGKMYVVE